MRLYSGTPLFICLSKCQTAQQPFAICLSQKFGKETSNNSISYKSLIDIGFRYLDHRLERHCSTNLNLRFSLTQRGTNIFSFLRLRATDNPRC
nr:MAG TPA: hypothetical protein [Bacteriophage sp.]